jgi:hypothetical protein
MRSLANSWMESKDPSLLIAASWVGFAIVNVTSLGVRGTDRGSGDFAGASLREAPTPLRMTAVEAYRVLFVFDGYH